jgi:hypothetical protein
MSFTRKSIRFVQFLAKLKYYNPGYTIVDWTNGSRISKDETIALSGFLNS